MNHSEIQRNLEAFYDRQLAAGPQGEIEAHLRDCRPCAETVAGLVAISKAVFRPVAVPNTDFFVSRVMARVRDLEPEAVGTFWRWPALALMAAAIFLILADPADSVSVPDSRVSTRTLLLADAGGAAPSDAGSAEPLDSLLDLTSEDI
jgi:anti-sigma factor RsiW